MESPERRRVLWWFNVVVGAVILGLSLFASFLMRDLGFWNRIGTTLALVAMSFLATVLAVLRDHELSAAPSGKLGNVAHEPRLKRLENFLREYKATMALAGSVLAAAIGLIGALSGS